MILRSNYKSVGEGETSRKFAHVDRARLALVISAGHHPVMGAHTEKNNRADTIKKAKVDQQITFQ